MLVFSEQKLAFLAVPKTGTTAFEMALRPRADIILSKRRKHLNAARFHNKVAPFLADTFGLTVETMAVMRDPVEQLRSWYRYRSGPQQKGTKTSTMGCSFDDFVLAVISDDPPPFAGVGSQFNFVTSGKGVVLVNHLFAYEHQPVFRAFLAQAFDKEVVLKQKNVSPAAEAPLSGAVEASLRKARASEFALYDQIKSAGGHLVTPVGG
ncbi:hypothetical protein [Pseudosulfitobacter koreensis]|uniref:Sulfotransferase family protein n=1 Tax=Pseudosulfitobacter koreensis TaxID=2968472 RepID=A0ABT1YZH2_9RHOB|nr:hypothetical protein [Pseudosulfitobacter koreense]MCR8826271.1 hypothetical protein [Pseudosulfitobacter koreense]